MLKRSKISTKITLTIAVITTVSVLIASCVGFIIAKKYIKATRLSELEDIATLKVDKIETFFNERRGDIETIQHYLNIKTNFPLLIQFAKDRTNPAYTNAKKMLDQQMEVVSRVYGYIDITLIDPEGVVVYVLNEARVKIDLDNILHDDPTGSVFKEGKKGIYFSEIYKCSFEINSFEMLAMAPINDSEGRFIGVVSLQINMSPIYKFMQETTGMGKTGETIIGKDIGTAALFLNPLHFDKESALKRKAIYGEKNSYPMQEAVRGRNGSGLSVDYRGKKVIAAWQYIPSIRWGLVIKADESEAFALINKLSTLMFILSFGVIAIALIVGYIISNHLTTPVKKLTNVAIRISKGDFNLRSDIRTKDEIGLLASNFNSMAEALQEEINERKLAEDTALRQTDIVNAIDIVLRKSLLLETEEDIGKLFLTAAEKVTNSKFGFIGEINSAGLFDTIAISNLGWDACNMPHSDATMHIKNMKIRGIDRATMRDGESRIVNEPSTHPDKAGAPKGHPPVTSFLGIPLKRMNKTIGMIGLGNKENGYDEFDQEAIEDLSVAFVEALMYRRSREELKTTNQALVFEASERKRIEEKLVREEKQAVLGKFACGVSHELRNPLGIINNSVYFLKMILTDADVKVKEYLDKISFEVMRSTDIISGLLDFGRTQPVNNKEKVVVTNMLNLALQRLPAPKNIELKTDIPSDLPTIYVDPRKIGQVLLNVVNNGYQAMPEGGLLVITASAENQYVNISIADSGTGISPENMDKIFEPLFTTKIRGFGIGLVLAKNLTESNGGSIEVKSEDGKGTTFTLKLPVKEVIS